MDKNNKPRIPLNRKNIHEIDPGKSKNTRTDSNLDPEDISNPFAEAQSETESSTTHEENSSDSSDAINNPFTETKQSSYEDDSKTNDTSSVEQPVENLYPNISTQAASPDVDLIIDAEMPYFFVFGNSTAGKSAMLSGLLYYIQTSRIGQLRSLSLNEHEHHRKGDYILSEMTKKVRKGEFIAGTQTLDTTDFVFPTEINLEFQPNGRPNMPFCLLEMAGEDLREIELRDEGKAGGDFDERINAYLQHPECQMIFICVVDVDTPANSEDLINQFLRYIHKIGHTSNPVLISINKWDKIANQYANAKEYIEQELPILANNLFDENRDMAYMKFSIGNVISNNEKDTYKYKPEDSEKLLKWMYETATGTSLDQEIKKSPGSKLFKSLKNLFSND